MCSEELWEAGCVGDDCAVLLAKGDIANSEWYSLCAGCRFGVLSNPEEIEEGNVDEACNGFLLVAGLLGLAALFEQVLGEAHRHGVLGLGRWVLLLVGVHDALELGDVALVGAPDVDGVEFASLFEGLADGAKRCQN